AARAAGGGAGGEPRGGGRLGELTDRGDEAPVVAVRDLADDQGEQHDRRELREADQAEVERAAGQVVELPADRDPQHVECAVGEHPRAPEQGKRGMSEQHRGIVAEPTRDSVSATEGAMRQGFRVIDSDTHVNPSLDVLLRYADKELMERIDDLKPYRRTVKTAAGRGDAEDAGSSTILSVKPVRLQRVAGQKPATAAQADGDRGFLSGRTQMVTRQPITPRVAEDNAGGRLRDMDLDGRDIDFIIPGPWAYGAPALAPHLAHGLYRAYHRYMAEYCAADSRRLKSMVLALATDPEWSAQVITERAREDWVAAVWPLLPEGMPVDDPDLEPIWAAADDADLPIMYHAFTIETPYFPGYRDIWDNPAMGRCAGQTWGGQRFLSFMLMGGMLDRYPRLRVGALESGHGWLPHWLVRLTRQIDYVRGSGSPALKHTPPEDAPAGGVLVITRPSRGGGACLRQHRSLRRGRAHEGGDRSLGRPSTHVRVRLSPPGDDLSRPRRHRDRVANGAR